MSSELVIGRNAVLEVLRHKPEIVLRVLIAGGHEDKQGPLAEVVELANGSNKQIESVSKEDLNKKAASLSHQSVALEIKQRQFLDLKKFIKDGSKKTKSLVLALDSLEDPHNLGALLRAAECFAVDAVVWSKNRGASISPAVSKVSVGASELVDIVQVSNLADALGKLKKAGYWVVLAGNYDGGQSLESFSWPEKTVLIMGSEGKGARPSIVQISDFYVWIPIVGRIDSLNVSQAGAVLMSAAAKQINA